MQIETLSPYVICQCGLQKFFLFFNPDKGIYEKILWGDEIENKGNIVIAKRGGHFYPACIDEQLGKAYSMESFAEENMVEFLDNGYLFRSEGGTFFVDKKETINVGTQIVLSGGEICFKNKDVLYYVQRYRETPLPEAPATGIDINVLRREEGVTYVKVEKNGMFKKEKVKFCKDGEIGYLRFD